MNSFNKSDFANAQTYSIQQELITLNHFCHKTYTNIKEEQFFKLTMKQSRAWNAINFISLALEDESSNWSSLAKISSLDGIWTLNLSMDSPAH